MELAPQAVPGIRAGLPRWPLTGKAARPQLSPAPQPLSSGLPQKRHESPLPLEWGCWGNS